MSDFGSNFGSSAGASPASDSVLQKYHPHDWQQDLLSSLLTKKEQKENGTILREHLGLGSMEEKYHSAEPVLVSALHDSHGRERVRFCARLVPGGCSEELRLRVPQGKECARLDQDKSSKTEVKQDGELLGQTSEKAQRPNGE